MNRIIVSTIFCFFSVLATAQYTEIINSKRPGFSESPYGVGSGVYQVETGFFYNETNSKSLFAFPNTIGGKIFLRHSRFSEKLEFNVNLTYQQDEVRNILGPNYDINGISDLTIGAKFLFYQQEYTDKSKEIRSWKRKMAFDKKRLIPSVGLYIGAHTKFVSKDYRTYHIDAPNKRIFNEEGISYKAALLLQNDFTDRLVLLTNLIADRLTTENQFYSYIATVTYAVDERWSYFVENQGWFQDKYQPKYQIGTGIAFLIHPDMQVDLSARTNFFADYSYTYLGTGIAWRLDKHEDYWVYKNAPTSKASRKAKKRKPGNFFSRLFKKKN